MGMNQILWVTPLLLLPGVGLLIMSTSARITRLHDELHHLLDHDEGTEVIELLWARARLLQPALVAQYLSVAFLATSSLVGGAAELFETHAPVVVVGLTCLAISSLVTSAALLVLESRRLVEILRHHYETMRARAR